MEPVPLPVLVAPDARVHQRRVQHERGRRVVVAVLAVLIGVMGRKPIALSTTPRLRQETPAPALDRQYFKDFPKGGELHIHLTGATHPDHLITWAIEDGLCVTKDHSIVEPKNGSCEPDEKVDEKKRAELKLKLSCEKNCNANEFFGRVVHRRYARQDRRGDMLSKLRNELAKQGTFYAEIMLGPGPARDKVAGHAKKSGWKGAVNDTLSDLKKYVEPEAKNVMIETDFMWNRSQTLLKCGTGGQEEKGCYVTVRYLHQTKRTESKEVVLAQLMLGAEVVKLEKEREKQDGIARWVGLQLVDDENHPTAKKDYDLHMDMIKAVRKEYGVKVALHSGEGTLAEATQEDLWDRIPKAVDAGASRIGHGCSVSHGESEIFDKMKALNVTVEVNLVSNHRVLGISPGDSNVQLFLNKGVPIALSTDDSGIFLTDLTEQFIQARNAISDPKTKTNPEVYENMARNALAFSFLPGKGLWEDPGTYKKPVETCSKFIGQTARPNGQCENFLWSNRKAREQWCHEWLLANFTATNTERPPQLSVLKRLFNVLVEFLSKAFNRQHQELQSKALCKWQQLQVAASRA